MSAMPLSGSTRCRASRLSDESRVAACLSRWKVGEMCLEAHVSPAVAAIVDVSLPAVEETGGRGGVGTHRGMT